MSNKKIPLIYIEINEKDYPSHEPFTSWIRTDSFRDRSWIAANQLSVVEDAASNFCITASREWIEQNCPTLLQEDMLYCVMPEDVGLCYSKNDIKFLDYNEGYHKW